MASPFNKFCFFILYFYLLKKKVDSIPPWVCMVIDRRRHQNKEGEHRWQTRLRLILPIFFVFSTFWRDLWSITEQTLNFFLILKINERLQYECMPMNLTFTVVPNVSQPADAFRYAWFACSTILARRRQTGPALVPWGLHWKVHNNQGIKKWSLTLTHI